MVPMGPDMKSVHDDSAPHAVCGPSTGYGRSRFHKAVCDMDMAAIQIGLSLNSDHLQRRDEAGFCPIHSACALCMKNVQNSSIAVDIVRVLLTAGADAATADSKGNTPLHWAVRSGDRNTTDFLLSKNSPQGKFARALGILA
jgi:ankyrin repeat protein